MKSKLKFSLIGMALISFSLVGQVTLKVGDKAPNFSGNDQDGNTVSLKQFKGKKVILYFYPKDDTPGCTAEACNLRDNNAMLAGEGYEILGVSGDDASSHKDFKTKYSLPFSLIADTDKSINQLYGVWVERERDGKIYFATARTTFVIDEKGLITKIIDKVDTKDHAKQIIN
jgi:peroxiredoxin Q/BCP